MGFAQEGALKGQSGKEVTNIGKRKETRGPKEVEKEAGSEEAVTISAERFEPVP